VEPDERQRAVAQAARLENVPKEGRPRSVKAYAAGITNWRPISHIPRAAGKPSGWQGWSTARQRSYVGASSPRAFASFAIFAKRLRSVFTLRTLGSSTVFPASIRGIASESCLTLIGVGRSAERPIVSRPA
jgi:hypothetical protein